MTLRTYRHFICPNGHKGVEKTRENDQPYSTNWESVTITGMRSAGIDERGYSTFVCLECNRPMKPDSQA